MLLDFAMPGMNGAEVAREIARAAARTCPILFATGYADAEALVDVDRDQLIQKPYVEEQVANKVAAKLANRPPRSRRA